MHLAALEQQREFMRYMNSSNERTKDHQAKLHGISARVDQLHENMNRLGLANLTRQSCRLHHLYVPAYTNVKL